MHPYIILANLVVFLHLVYVAFVPLGLVVVWVGYFCRWQWVRNFWFRVIHLLMIGVVVLETVFRIECPLTTWENQLREAAGQDIRGEDFIARFLNDLIYWDAPKWVFPLMYYGFGALVLLTFLVVRPRWPWQRVDKAAELASRGVGGSSAAGL